jgi:hypothetical protein
MSSICQWQCEPDFSGIHFTQVLSVLSILFALVFLGCSLHWLQLCVKYEFNILSQNCLPSLSVKLWEIGCVGSIAASNLESRGFKSRPKDDLSWPRIFFPHCVQADIGIVHQLGARFNSYPRRCYRLFVTKRKTKIKLQMLLWTVWNSMRTCRSCTVRTWGVIKKLFLTVNKVL